MMSTDSIADVGPGLRLLLEVLRLTRQSNYWWRGQEEDWSLLPKANREPWRNHDPARAFTEWCRLACRYAMLPDPLLDRLALAQHHGLATPLLDWSSNPLVAIYFAARNETKKDGVVYALHPPLEDPLGAAPRIKKVGGRRTPTGGTNWPMAWEFAGERL
jgi:hypothetical protein